MPFPEQFELAIIIHKTANLSSFYASKNRSVERFFDAMCRGEDLNLTDSVHLLDILFALRAPKYLKSFSSPRNAPL